METLEPRQAVGPSGVVFFRSETAVPTSPTCLAPLPVVSDRLAPDLRTGDRLLPVTCETRRPRFGEFVLAEATRAPGPLLLRFIGPPPFRRSGQAPYFLAWDGRDYISLPSTALRGRILSVVRDGRSWDLSVGRGLPGRETFGRGAHHLLSMVRRVLRNR